MYKDVKNLIGTKVKAVGSCGMTKNQEIEGILSLKDNDWIVTIPKKDGFNLPCSVYYQTIEEIK